MKLFSPWLVSSPLSICNILSLSFSSWEKGKGCGRYWFGCGRFCWCWGGWKRGFKATSAVDVLILRLRLLDVEACTSVSYEEWTSTCLSRSFYSKYTPHHTDEIYMHFLKGKHTLAENYLLLSLWCVVLTWLGNLERLVKKGDQNFLCLPCSKRKI